MTTNDQYIISVERRRSIARAAGYDESLERQVSKFAAVFLDQST